MLPSQLRHDNGQLHFYNGWTNIPYEALEFKNEYLS